MRKRLYNSKYVQVAQSSNLSPKELAQVLDLVLSHLGKEIVKTDYISHGDDPVVEFTLGDEGKTEQGLFDQDGNKV